MSDDDDVIVMRKKDVYSMSPEDRAVWLSKAFKKVNDGGIKPNQLYDVLSSPKLAEDLPEKIGLRMLRTLRKHMYLFSAKQQRYLADHALMAYEVANKERRKQQAPVTTSVNSGDDDAAARMEEMMARCRNFVRAQASTYGEKEKTAIEMEKQARLKKEWDAIDAWHRELEEWEKVALAKEDILLHKKAWEAEKVRRQAIEKWETESRERARVQAEVFAVEDAKRQEELRIQREKFMAQEEAYRLEEEAKQRKRAEQEAEDIRKKEERYQAQLRRREAEKRERDMEMWRRQQIEKEEEKRREFERQRVEEERRQQRAEEERRNTEARHRADDQRRRAMEGQRAVTDALQRAAASVTTSLKYREAERDVVRSIQSRGPEPAARSQPPNIMLNMPKAPPGAPPAGGDAPSSSTGNTEASKVSPLLGLLRGSSNVVIDVPAQKKRKTEEEDYGSSDGRGAASGWLLPSRR